MAALNGAIADARRPRGAVIVGDDLHLDMARTLDEVLEKNSGIAEGFECFGAGTFEGVRQLVCRVHEANPVTAPACCRLDEQRKTDTVGLGSGICQGFHRPTAPGSDCDLGVLRKTFGSDLVAELAHHVAGRSDENDSHLTAEIGERGVFCHKAPADPDGIGTSRRKCLFEPPVVEVAALKMMRLRIGKLGRTEAYRFVGFANEHGMTIGLGEERDGTQWYAVLVSELAGCMNETHGSFPAIDNRNALKFILHRHPDKASWLFGLHFVTPPGVHLLT